MIAAVGQGFRDGERFRVGLPALVDDCVAGDLVQPGADVASPELFWEMVPCALPNVLVQVFAIRGPHSRRDESEKQRRVAAIELLKGLAGGAGAPSDSPRLATTAARSSSVRSVWGTVDVMPPSVH